MSVEVCLETSTVLWARGAFGTSSTPPQRCNHVSPEKRSSRSILPGCWRMNISRRAANRTFYLASRATQPIVATLCTGSFQRMAMPPSALSTKHLFTTWWSTTETYLMVVSILDTNFLVDRLEVHWFWLRARRVTNWRTSVTLYKTLCSNER